MVRKTVITIALWLGLSTLANSWSESTWMDSVFSEVELEYSIPEGLLRSVAWQESRFDINARGAAGEIGLMQIHPRWHTVPCSPAEQVRYAGRYLVAQHRRFGSWAYALMAYNWGPTNLSNALSRGRPVPGGVQSYATDIIGRL